MTPRSLEVRTPRLTNKTPSVTAWYYITGFSCLLLWVWNSELLETRTTSWNEIMFEFYSFPTPFYAYFEGSCSGLCRTYNSSYNLRWCDIRSRENKVFSFLTLWKRWAHRRGWRKLHIQKAQFRSRGQRREYDHYLGEVLGKDLEWPVVWDRTYWSRKDESRDLAS